MGAAMFLSLGSLTGTGAGTAYDISHLEEYSVLIGGTFVGTVDIELSYDGGTVWVVHPDMSAKTAPIIVPDGGMRPKQIRANCTAFTSGTIEVQVAGTDTDNKG